MKKIIFNIQMRNKHFFIVIYHSSLVKAAINAAQKNASISSFLQWRNKDHSALGNGRGIEFLKLR
jgi:hypothetical protein